MRIIISLFRAGNSAFLSRGKCTLSLIAKFIATFLFDPENNSSNCTSLNKPRVIANEPKLSDTAGDCNKRDCIMNCQQNRAYREKWTINTYTNVLTPRLEEGARPSALLACEVLFFFRAIDRSTMHAFNSLKRHMLVDHQKSMWRNDGSGQNVHRTLGLNTTY